MATPLYMKVVRALTADIQNGVVPVGSRLAPETDLSVRYEVSRHTIREALRHMKQEELISSRQGSGWVVVSTGKDKRYVHAVSSISEIFEYASEIKLNVLKSGIEKVTPLTAARLECSPGREWLRIEGLRLLPDGKPLCWVVVYIAGQYKSIAEDIPGHHGPILSLIQERFGDEVATVSQMMNVRPVPDVGAAPLGLSEGSQVVEIRRKFLGTTGKTMEVTFSYYPVERFSYSVTLHKEVSPTN